ncbi:MAG: hypothetical protein IJ325_06905 [Clostridia bacterium]|nr:hypothetical protein [Clostridia bacterium]
MRTDQIVLRHLLGYDSRFIPVYKEYTAHKTVVFRSAAMTEKGHHKCSAVVYFFPRFSRLTDQSGGSLPFSAVGFAPGDKLYFGPDDKTGWTVMKITPYLTGSDRVEHYRLECMA